MRKLNYNKISEGCKKNLISRSNNCKNQVIIYEYEVL